MDTKLSLNGCEIRVLDGPYTDGHVPTPVASAFAQELTSMLPQMKQFAAQQLLDTYNDAWAEDEDLELESTQFEVKLVSPRIVICDEMGAATVPALLRSPFMAVGRK